MEIAGIHGIDPGNDTRRARVPARAVPWGIGRRYVSMRVLLKTVR